MRASERRTLIAAIVTAIVTPSVIANQYAVMIDAGSTGSRAYVYEWQSRVYTPPLELPPPLTRPITQSGWSLQLEPGVSHLSGSALTGQLDQLLAFAKATLSKQQPAPALSDVPVYLFATAGVRTMEREKRDGLMEEISTHFAASEFSFTKGSARSISGEEEAAFGWVTVNYLLNTLSSSDTSTGALDLGGASTQVTFEPQSDSILASAFPLNLAKGMQHNLYAHSYLYYGNNEAAALVYNDVLAEEPTGETVQNPCFATGYSRYYNASSVMTALKPSRPGASAAKSRKAERPVTKRMHKAYGLVECSTPANLVPTTPSHLTCMSPLISHLHVSSRQSPSKGRPHTSNAAPGHSRSSARTTPPVSRAIEASAQ
jgi:Golgi nucleoside diphosphatase